MSPSKKGPSKGTGGHGRRALQGKGPTPPAKERPKHPAARRARAAAKRAGGGRPQPARSRRATSPDLVAGRNAVVEALRASVPATTLYVAVGLDHDDRISESRKLAAAAGVGFLDVT